MTNCNILGHHYGIEAKTHIFGEIDRDLKILYTLRVQKLDNISGKLLYLFIK